MHREQLSRPERFEANKIISEKTGYSIKSRRILNQIFTRSSLAAETGKGSNEIFEFVGDQVFSFYLVMLVSKRCGSLSPTDAYTFRIRENQFTQIKQALVNNDTFARIIDEWNIAKYLLVGKSDVKNNVVNETKVKADLLEAVIGAIAIESKWDPDILETAVSKVLNFEETINTMIEHDPKARSFDLDTAVSTLKELAEHGQCPMPDYEFAGPESLGYDPDGNPRWTCTCTTLSDDIYARKMIEATSKKDAKKAAAYLVLCEYFGAQNKYGPNKDFDMFWAYKGGKLFPDSALMREEA